MKGKLLNWLFPPRKPKPDYSHMVFDKDTGAVSLKPGHLRVLVKRYLAKPGPL